MKKLLFFFLIVFISIIVFLQGINNHVVRGEDEYQVIPDEAIRLRILSNSDHEDDQEIKYMIRNEVNEQIASWVEHLTSIDVARSIIQERLPEITETVENILTETNSAYTAQVQYDKNVTFPLKMYDTYIYPPGEYEAILITIGAGKGSNWWCVLFPPLCFLDFANGSIVADKSDDEHVDEDEEQTEEDQVEEGKVKVKFFLFEWLGWT